VHAVAEQQNQPVDLLRDVGIDQKLDVQVPPELPFVDESGQAVTLQKYFSERPIVLALIYHNCPMLCGLEMDGLIRSLRSLSLSAGEDFEVVIVSIDPKEGPALAAQKKKSALARYARDGAEQGWHFLTGKSESIATLTDAVGFRYVEDKKTGQFAHAAGIVLLTPQGKTSRYFYGVEFPPRDVRLGLVEASQHKIGTLADRVLLFCYHYDPTNGKYGLAILNILRAGGALTVISLAAAIAFMLRRERRGAQTVHADARSADA
jgi:protein SCO1/2